jgi:hypothetical protein
MNVDLLLIRFLFLKLIDSQSTDILKRTASTSPVYTKNTIPCFSMDNAHLMYNAHPKLFYTPFDVWITRVTLTSSRIRKYRPLLTEDIKSYS